MSRESESKSAESNSIDCDSFEDRIHQLLDDRLSLIADKRLNVHANTCDPCHEILDDYNSVDDSVKLLKGDIDQILNETRATNSGTGISGSLWPSGTLVVAATLATMIVTLVGAFNFLGESQDGQTRTAQRWNFNMDYGDPINAAVAVPNIASQPHTIKDTPQRQSNHVTLRTSPFSSEFRGYSISQISVDSVNPLNQLPKWSQFANPLEPVLHYSAELPGVRPVQCSVNVTIDLLMKSFVKQDDSETPDLGLYRAHAALVSA